MLIHEQITFSAFSFAARSSSRHAALESGRYIAVSICFSGASAPGGRPFGSVSGNNMVRGAGDDGGLAVVSTATG